MKTNVKIVIVTIVVIAIGIVFCVRNTSQSRNIKPVFVNFPEPSTSNAKVITYNEQPVAEELIEDCAQKTTSVEQILHNERGVAVKTIRDENYLYCITRVNRHPEFEGGVAKKQDFLLANNLTVEKTNNRMVMSSFVVEIDGSITDINILGGFITEGGGRRVGTVDITQSVKEDAIRLIQSMPKWTPAQLNGKAVRTRIALPIPFYLE